MRVVIALFLIFLLSLINVTSAMAESKEKLMSAYFGVVMIRGYHSNGGLAYGSGVVVAKDTVVTNCHVLRATKQPWIARGEDTYNITSVKADTWHDLCLVSAPGLPFTPTPLGKSTTLKRGQEIVAFGHSNGVPAPLTSTGRVLGLYDVEAGKMIRSSAQFRMGASGSGLFNLDGELIGINTFKTAGTGGSIYFALPVEWLQTLEKLPEQTTFPISGKALWEEDEDKKPFYMQAAVPESRQNWPKLAEVAERWTKAEPNSSDAWLSLGLGLQGTGQTDAAERAYKKSFELDTNNAEALLSLGEIAKARGDNTELQRIQAALAAINHEGD